MAKYINWKAYQGTDSKSYRPLALFYYHTTFSSETQCGISFMEVGPQTFKVLNKMWSQGITEWQKDMANSKQGYKTFFCNGIMEEQKNGQM